MKTTLNIDSEVMTRLKQEAARRGTTMSKLVEAALRMLLDAPEAPAEVPPLPNWRGGRAHVDISNRDALYDLMEGGSRRSS